MVQYYCFKCESTWTGRKETRPRVCPRCHSAWWDVPKVEKKKTARKGEE